ncbi:MAG: DUF72 domain-containing protein [Proteobacteria bacterium]|nr:DUF72 domain-containing protein [Pseudomonadota bacterium]
MSSFNEQADREKVRNAQAVSKYAGNMQVGAYGWLHPSWQVAFYPEDLPQDWMLSYYSNELNTVMVPADYWYEGSGFDCESWLNDIHDDFSFYVECPEQLLVSEANIDTLLTDGSGFSVFFRQMESLRQHLAGVVITGIQSEYSGSNPVALAKLQAISGLTDLFSYNEFQGAPCRAIWLREENGSSRGEMSFISQEASSATSLSTPLAVFDDDLRYLRETRPRIERFASQLAGGCNAVGCVSPPTIIVKHEALKASDLIKFRSLIEIMGL